MIVLKQKRNLTKCFYSPQDREKVFQILEAPPGSGKTYTSLLHSIELAKKGYVIIFTFPNKNLLEVNFREAIKLANNDDDDNEQKISIHQHYMEAYIQDSDLLNIFLSGAAIIFTLHVYLFNRGDFFQYSTLFFFTKTFTIKTFVIVDEAHEYFNQFQKDYQISFATVPVMNRRKVVFSLTHITSLKEYLNYEISAPTIDGKIIYQKMKK